MIKKILRGLVLIAVFFAFIPAVNSEENKNDDLYKQVSLFSDALAIIQSDYVSEVKPKDLIYGALKGMLSELDSHSQFMDPDTYNELKTDTEGKFGGIGIEISMKDGLLIVITPLEDTPAWKAGIKAGDIIVKIDDELTRDFTVTDAVKRLRGKPGDEVSVTILRESEKKVLDFKIVRDIIKIKDIKEAKILEDGIGYIRIVEFRENTPVDLDVALEKLKKEGMNALIIDLRNNPGGLLDVAVRVTEKFIDKNKLIVYTQGRKASQNIKSISTFSNPHLDFPMVILINEGSASASEIVAVALQDYKRAILVGKKSFGKGSVQTIIPLSDGSALRLTSSKYFSPLGREIHGKGIMPDIEVEEGRVELVKKEENEDIFAEIEKKVKVKKTDKEEKVKEEKIKGEKISEEEKKWDYRHDNQIIRAIDVMKAVKIYKNITK